MNETSPSLDSKPRRTPVPTPPPRPVAPAALSLSESSSEESLDALLAEQRAGEAWIKLTPVQFIRAADVREIEETGKATYEGQDEAGNNASYEWPINGLLINGKPVTQPQWTLEELLAEIGVEVCESPTVRTWKARRSTPAKNDQGTT